MKARRPPENPDSSTAAYSRALAWLTARELSGAQVRTRLADRGYSSGAIDAAVQRLIDNRALDDRRAAMSVARAEVRGRGRGPGRVMGRLLHMRIDRDLAKEVVREVFGDTPEDDLLEAALNRRLRGRPERLADPLERRKLVAYLIRQGYSASSAARAVRSKSRP